MTTHTEITPDILIALRNIVKNYYIGTHKVRVLKSINLTIKKQEFLAIMGPSGSGKTTLMNILGCLDTPSEGEYFLAQKDVSKFSQSELAHIRNEEIGFVFQSFNLLSKSTAFRNVQIPLLYSKKKNKKMRKQLAEYYLEFEGLKDRMHHIPNQLSGGQKQRVAIARALINSPSMILADEPTGNIDSATGNKIMGLFEELNQQGNTIIIVTHEEEIARLCRRIIRLKDGVIYQDEVLRTL